MSEFNFYSRDIQILRQSQQKMAYEYLSDRGIEVSMSHLQRITDLFVECCIRPIDDDLRQKIVSFEKWVEQKSDKTIKVKITEEKSSS